jgi:hypothetical protein
MNKILMVMIFILVVLISAKLLLNNKLHHVNIEVKDSGAYGCGNDNEIKRLFDQRQSNVQVTACGVLIRILDDDNKGSRHQKFIIKLSSGQTLLIAHNIDIAPRIDGIQVGNEIKVYGEYEWNDKGGVIHWTHHDPDARHQDGWIEYNSKTYK